MRTTKNRARTGTDLRSNAQQIRVTRMQGTA